MNTHTSVKNPVSKRPHLLRLVGVNLSLAVLLSLQAGSVRIDANDAAWLVSRTPAMTEMLHEAAEESAASSNMMVAIEDVQPLIPYLEEEEVSSVEDVTIDVSTSSVSSETPVVIQSSELSESSESSIPAAETPVSASASASSASTTPVIVVPSAFPAFDHAVSPVYRTPNWGAMKTPAEWNRSYDQMAKNDFVQIPAYDLRTLQTPMSLLAKTRDEEETIRMITAKLYYSTRYFGAYNLDAGEFTAVHPGIDLKLAEGTPVGAVAGGRVHDVRHDEKSLGIHVIIEHRAPDGQTYYSIYGHLEEAWVVKGDVVTPGASIGAVGMTGNTSGPHLHLQIDVGEPDETYHAIYWPDGVPSADEASEHAINPVVFIRRYATGN